MRHSWRIGRAFGIDINIDSSWFLIFILFSWVLAANYYPQGYPGWSQGLYWFIGVMTSLLIFTSVLIHELAHSLVAIQQGEKVKNITLFILGGVAQITEEPKKPLQELLMALVGPLASFGLGFIFFIVALFLKGTSIPLHAALSYLALINLVLGIFNLLPGFPMDGGRVLRSIIWKITGNLRKATRIASRTGQGFAFLLMVLGGVQVIRGYLSGLWLIFIGWFLHSAAVRGYRRVMVETVLKGVSAGDLMTKDYESVRHDLLVQELVDDFILKKRERVFLVLEEEEVRGIVCLEDVKATPRERWSEYRVEDIMTPREKLMFVSLEADGSEILDSLTANDIHQIPVLKQGRIVGIICRSDVLRFIQLRSELGV